MRRWIATATILFVCGWAAGATPAQAQLMDSLKGAGSGMAGGLGGLSMPQVGSASSGNVAGVLKYCVRNKYLGASGASTDSSLLGKLGSGATSSSQYEAGNQGTLETGQGRDVSLGGGSGSLKGKLTQKVCDQVLSHAKSLL